MELTQEQLNEIARLILEGYTSGLLDDENERLSWELKTEIIKD